MTIRAYLIKFSKNIYLISDFIKIRNDLLFDNDYIFLNLKQTHHKISFF